MDLTRWLFVFVIAYLVLAVICLPLKTFDDDINTKADGELSNRLRRSIDSLPFRRSKRMNAVAPALAKDYGSISKSKGGKTKKPSFVDKWKSKAKEKTDPTSLIWKILTPILIVVGVILGLIGLCAAAAFVYFCFLRNPTGGRLPTPTIFAGKRKNKRPQQGKWEEEDEDEEEEEQEDEEEEEQPGPVTKKKSKTKSKSKSKAKSKSKSKSKSKAKGKSKSKAKPKLKGKRKKKK